MKNVMKRFLAVLLVIVLIGGNLSTAALADDWDWSYEGFSEDDWYDDGWSESYDYYTSSAQEQASTTYDYPEYNYETDEAAPEASFDWDGFDKDEFDWSKIFLGEDGYWYTADGEKLFSDEELNDWLNGMEPSEDTGLIDAEGIRAILDAEHEDEAEVVSNESEGLYTVTVYTYIYPAGVISGFENGKSHTSESVASGTSVDLSALVDRTGMDTRLDLQFTLDKYVKVSGDDGHLTKDNSEDAAYVVDNSDAKVNAIYIASGMEIETFSITYDPGDAGGHSNAAWEYSFGDRTETVYYNKLAGDTPSYTLVIPAAAPTCVEFTVGTDSYGYQFLGWKGSDGTTYQPGDTVDITGDITLIAQWAPSAVRPFYLKYLREDALNYPNDETKVSADGTVTFTAGAAPSRRGYKFVEWRGSDGATYGPGAEVTVAKDQTFTLTAGWEELELTGVAFERVTDPGEYPMAGVNYDQTPVINVGGSVVLQYKVTVYGAAGTVYTVNDKEHEIDASGVGVVYVTKSFDYETALTNNGALSYAANVKSGIDPNEIGVQPVITYVKFPPQVPAAVDCAKLITVKADCINDDPAAAEHVSLNVTDAPDLFIPGSVRYIDGEFVMTVTISAQAAAAAYRAAYSEPNHALAALEGDKVVTLRSEEGQWAADVTEVTINVTCTTILTVHYMNADGSVGDSQVFEDGVTPAADPSTVNVAAQYMKFLGWTTTKGGDVVEYVIGDSLNRNGIEVNLYLYPVWAQYEADDFTTTISQDGWYYGDATDPVVSISDYSDVYGAPQLVYTQGDETLDGRPVHVGSYKVQAIYKGNGLLPEVKTEEVSFQISKRPVTFTSRNIYKDWDGSPLTNARYYEMDGDALATGISISGMGLADGDNVIFHFTGTYTIPGTADNSFEVEWVNCSASDYEWNGVFGELSIAYSTNPGGGVGGTDVTPEPNVTPEPVVPPEIPASPEPSEQPDVTPEPSTPVQPVEPTEEPDVTPEPGTEPDVTPEPAEPTVRPVVPTPPQNGGDVALPSDADFGNDYDPNSPELEEPAAPAEPVTPAEPETPAAPEAPVAPVAPETPDDTTPAAPAGPTEINPDDTPLDDVPQIPGADDNAPSATPRPAATPAPTASPAPAAPVDDDSDDNGAEPDGDVTIDEDDTPLADLPEVDGEVAEPELTIDEEVIIDEDETPLANFTDCCALHFVLMVLALAVAVYYTYDRKKRQAREFEVRSEL